MKKLLILGAGEMQLPIIIRAKELGIYAIVADYNTDAPGLKFADIRIHKSTTDYKELLLAAKHYEIDGILTTSDYPVNIVANIAQELNLVAVPVNVASICTNKYAQRLLFKENNLNVPEFKVCKLIDEVYEFKQYPYIIKPIDSSASRGVRRINNKEELLKYYDDSISYSRNNKVIVETIIKGREFSVETLTQNYKTTIAAITEKHLIGVENGYFVENIHIQPAKITLEQKNIIEDTVIKALNIIGVNNCPTHTEVKLNEDGVFIIEIACRLGGDYITSDLVPLSTGIDMLANQIKLSLGEKIDTKQTIHKNSCVQFINNDNYEKCQSFISSQNKNIVRSHITSYHNSEIKNSNDRMGYIILQTETMNEIECILNYLNFNSNE